MSAQEPPKKKTAPPPAPSATPRAEPSIRVRATKLGYYDEKRRRLGDVFSLRSDADFTAKWMERVPDDTPERITTGQDELEQTRQEHLRAQRERAGTPPTGASSVLGE